MSSYVDMERAAVELDVSVRTIKDWMRRRRIPYYKIGRTVRFKLSDIHDQLEKNCRRGSPKPPASTASQPLPPSRR